MARRLPFNSAAIARYSGLIKSILLFLLLVIAVLTFNIYTSYLIERNAAQVAATQQLRGLTQTITRDLYDLKLSQGEDIRSPHIQSTVKRLTQSKENFSKILLAFKQSGEINNAEGNTFSVNALNAANKVHLDIIDDQWGILNGKLDQYLKVATNLRAPVLVLDQAVDSAQGTSIAIYNSSNAIVNAVDAASYKQATLIRYLQMGAISVAVLYFIVFMLYFVRRLTNSDAQANEARRETTEILDTVKTGLFLLDEDLMIGQQYSKELEGIIGHRDIGGRDFTDILESMISADDMTTTRGFIKQLYNPKVKERLIADLNPLSRIETSVDDLSGYQRTRFLDFQFSRVYSGRDIIRVLVNVADITDTVRLEQRLLQERENNDLQIDMLTTILNTDALLINDFISTVSHHNTTINNILKASGTSQSDLQGKLKQIFREIHSLKGNASSLNLFAFTNVSNAFEDKIKALQAEASLSGDDFLSLAVSLDELIKLTQIIDQLNQRISPNNAAAHVAEPTQAPRKAMAEKLQQFAQDLAKRQYKQVKVSTQDLEQTTSIPAIDNAIRDIAIQILRNAVVHGIETPSLRSTKKKSPTGHVQIHLQQTESQAQLTIEDDGQGINYDAIRERAVAIGLYSAKEIAEWDNRKLLGLLFSSGFSTYGQTDEDAGRGVGLDMVKDRVQKLGGKIGIHSQPSQFTRFSFTFPLNP